MPLFHVSATYETRKGGCGWAHLDIEAPDIAEAQRIAGERIKSDKRRNVRRVIDSRAAMNPRDFQVALSETIRAPDESEETPERLWVTNPNYPDAPENDPMRPTHAT